MKFDTEKIKISLCYRAKYRKSKMMVYPLWVVPHPRRCGETVTSLRTMQLTATIINNYDSREANLSAVAVEDKPVVAGNIGYFQDEFAKNVELDPDVAVQDSGIVAIFGSLSHSHLNCCMRNILCGKRGCECFFKNEVCACKNAPILDEDGNYSAVELRIYDASWALDCSSGLGWEILSYKMDIEQPDAANIISVTLNKRNEVAMKTGHLEIMSTLASLCTPDPQGIVLPFELVRDKMLGMYGAAVDNENFAHVFRLVIDAGGADSVHMQDLEHFTSTYVNERIRKMQMEVYAIVAPYPVHFPSIKIACIKWSWKQPTQNGWCPVPPSIAHRLYVGNPMGMHDFLFSVELAMRDLHTLASTVVEEKNLKTRWLAELDIVLMTKIFAVPNESVEGKTVQEQEQELCEQCAEFIATKMLELLKLKPEVQRKALFGFLNHSSDLRIAVWKHLVDPQFCGINASEKKENNEGHHNSVVAELLVTEVIQTDKERRPMGDHETVAAHFMTVVTNTTAKSLFLMTIVDLQHNWVTRCPITLQRKGGRVKAVTTQTLRAGELVVPLFLKHPSSVVAENEVIMTPLNPKAVSAVVSWPKSATAVRLMVQPEMQSAKLGADGSIRGVPSDNVHPFWFIQRTDCELRSCHDSKENARPYSGANAKIVHEEVSYVRNCSSSGWSSAAVKLPDASGTFMVSVPFIVNTHSIGAGQEVILRWDPPPEVDQIMMKDIRKRQRID